MPTTTPAKTRSAKKTTAKPVAKKTTAKKTTERATAVPQGTLPEPEVFRKQVLAQIKKSKEAVSLSALYEPIAKSLKLTAKQMEVASKEGEPIYKRRIRGAALRLRASGELKQTGPGEWVLA